MYYNDSHICREWEADRRLWKTHTFLHKLTLTSLSTTWIGGLTVKKTEQKIVVKKKSCDTEIEMI